MMNPARRPRLLLAEDHVEVAATFRRLLGVEFDVVDVVTDGQSLIARTEALRPDAILTDHWLEGSDSISATRELRRRYPHLLIVVMSADGDPALRANALAAGASRFVSKLEAMRSIADCLQDLLKGSSWH